MRNMIKKKKNYLRNVRIVCLNSISEVYVNSNTSEKIIIFKTLTGL